MQKGLPKDVIYWAFRMRQTVQKSLQKANSLTLTLLPISVVLTCSDFSRMMHENQISPAWKFSIIPILTSQWQSLWCHVWTVWCWNKRTMCPMHTCSPTWSRHLELQSPTTPRLSQQLQRIKTASHPKAQWPLHRCHLASESTRE